MGHTRCNKPHSPTHKITKCTTAHQKHGCRRAACAPVPTHAPLHLDKYKHIHTLLRCRYGDGRRWAWGTRGATSHTPTNNNTTPNTRWHHAACAPVLAHNPLHLKKYNHMHTLLRCRYGDGRRRAWATHGATSQTPTHWHTKLEHKESTTAHQIDSRHG